METDRIEVSPVPADHVGSADAEGAETPTTSAPKDRSSRSWGLGIAAAVAVLVLIGAVTVGFVSHAHLGQARSSLSSERARLRHTEALAATARSELAAVQGQSDAAGHTLASESTQLAADQAQLAHAQADVFAQGVSISELDTCLSGVEKSLNQISLDDQSGAAATLNGVAANCRAAEPSGT
jgi:uncharacterized protein HemX